MNNLFKSMQLRQLFMLMVLPTLCGCVPASYTYWAPKAQGGQSFKSLRGHIAPQDSIEFLFNGVQVQITGIGTGVGVVLRIPEGQSASFLSNEIEFHNDPVGKVVKIKFDITWWDPKSMKRLHFSPMDTFSDSPVVADIEFKCPESAHYWVKLPIIKVNDQIYEIPEIEFLRTIGFGVFGL